MESSFHSQQFQRRFKEVWREVQAAGDAQAAADRLLTAYENSMRGHHNTEHVVECLGLLDAHRNEVSCFNEMRLAFLWHDYVYEPTSATNELDSMVDAINSLKEAGLEDSVLSLVASLILTHENGLTLVSEDAKLFRDIDYWIVASPRERYERYATGIEKEYRSVFSQERYTAGRLDFLQKTLANPESIFLTAGYKARYQQQAMDNLAWEISKLK